MKPKAGKIARSARKLATKGTGKRWKKGQSSSSNPTANTHREAAKNRFFNVNLGPSTLTVDALQQHNQSEYGDDNNKGAAIFSELDNHSQSARTFSTWASNWTDCTNMTFNKVHRYWSSNNDFHKEVLAVLAAVTEVIKENGGTESETEYFAALISSLETVDSDESMAAIVYLLSLVIKKVPSEVLKSQFSNVAKKLMEYLEEHSNTDCTSLLKSLLKCLATLLRAQDPATWSEPSTCHIYNTLLAYSVHQKPKVRKEAHQCVCSVLKGSQFMLREESPAHSVTSPAQRTTSPAHHPAASQTAKYCVQTLEEHGAGKTSSSLHILGLLKDILGVLPKSGVKAVCETVLRLMTLSDVVTKSVCMQALHGLFLSRPKPTSLTAELNAQIIVALYDYRPGSNDSQPLSAWLAVITQAHINLARLDAALCVSHLPRLVSTCMQCMLAEREDGVQASADTIRLVIEECLAPNIEHVKKSMPAKSGSPIGKIYQALEAGLSYQYHNAWGRVLNAISALIQVLGKDYHNIMTKSLVTMADLRDSHRFSYKPEVDYAFSTAVKVLGPRLVLGAVPLLINGDEKDNLDFPRSWLMPILRDSIRDTELSYFIDYILPLAARIKDRATKLASEGTNAGAKTYEILHYQVWSLLPGFCTRPTDFKQSFKNLAKTLGTAIQTKSDLQLGCMASLRKLILQNKDHEENREELARFAKNYLPILFNLYSTDPDKLKDPVRLASLETIKFYVQITPDELLSSFYDRAFAKLNDESTVAFTRHALMDLVNAMLPYVSADRLESLYAWIVPNVKSKDRTTQKKAYRSLEELCGASSATCRQFVASRLPELKTILAESLSTAHASSKAPRLRCLINLFRNLEQGDMTFIQTVIPEAILCTKESAERARAAAYLLLIEMCESGARWLRAPKHETVLEYFKFVATGLEEKPHHVSTTLLALTRLLFHYRADASPPLLELLCTKLSELLASKAREIVEAAIGLLKVMLGSFREVELAKYLQEMVGGLVSMKDDNRHHFRFKAKEVFERLIRKFGYDTIRKMVPESHHKLINNIRKTQERVKRQKKQHGGDEEEEDYQDEFRRKSMPESLEDFLKDSDSELEDHEPETKKPKAKVKREKGGKAWLKEGDENDLVDFLDKSAAQKIMATQPAGGASESGVVKHDFKTAADGRLIITMDDSDDEEKNEKKSDIKADEIMEAMEMRTGKFRKRRRDAVPEDDDEPAMKYKPGGSGIHRPIAMATKKQDAASKHQDRMNKMKVSGDEYKAKKAKGDVKRKGKPDPYAYVPLNLSSLNRRKQAKFKGQFSNLVKGARKGAMAGRKSKAKKRK